ncbi:MAG TPA: hypothetical protein VGN35_06715 [Jatrophihabitantaceae bacterium]|nr:hypothetical protein [Jatrophihabitantaceae bacterium]
MHSWLLEEYGRGGLGEDTFSLVVKRSIAYELTAFGGDERSDIRWLHNDAGGDWTQDGQVRELAWFQIAVSENTAYRLPIQPAATILREILDRVGQWRFTGMHAVIPLYLARDARFDLAAMWPWFTFADPGSAITMTVQVSCVSAEQLRDRGGELLAAVKDRSHGQLAVQLAEPRYPDGQPSRQTGETFTRGMRPAVHFDCVAPEWSIDAVTWSLEIFVDALRCTTTDPAVLITVNRTDGG